MMRIFLLVITFLFISANVDAAGFVGPGSLEPVYSAREVLNARDDAPCALEGHIIARVRDRKNRYLFQDESGQVVVEIKKKVFGSATVTPQNLVRLEGEVNSNKRYPNEMDVEILTILK